MHHSWKPIRGTIQLTATALVLAAGAASAQGPASDAPPNDAPAAAAPDGSTPNSAAPDARSEPSLDELLLDDLGDGLLEGLDDVPVDPAFDLGDDDAGDVRSLDLPAGEDVQPGGEDVLTRIGRQMRLVERRIAQQEVSPATQQLQRQIEDDLAALIEQAKQQCRKNCNKNGRPSPKDQQVKQPGPPKHRSGENSNKPAEDSEERLGEAEVEIAEAESFEDVVKKVWGHLPDRARQQMQTPTVDKFLPKYQTVIEEYFRRLAEEESSRP